jgi:hypothetical protein
VETEARDEQIKELRAQWKALWDEKVEDRVRAEGIAKTDFSMLFIDKGTVIFATRNFSMPSLRNILKAHGLIDAEDKVFSNPHTGGWGKFVRDVLASPESNKGRSSRQRRFSVIREELEKSKKKQQLRKGGKGWLHL